MRLEPTNIQQIGNELAIQWNDGTESYLDLQFLRRACPCAACGGEPDVLGNIMRPNVSYSENSFELAGFDLVGGYALQPRWRDGHGTGIYSFQYLRRLAAPVKIGRAHVNSSHLVISYAVFCLKKKNRKLLSDLRSEEKENRQVKQEGKNQKT